MTGMSNIPTAAYDIVDSLIEEGIDTVFGMTGDTVLPLLDELYKRKDEIKYVTCRSEISVVSMADAYARATGQVGCCILHVGPSIANAVLGVWSAKKDSIPMMVISANMDRYRLGRDIWHEFDVTGVYGKFTKWNDQLVEAKDARRLMRTGFQVAKSGRPGPVHIDVPKDQFVLPGRIEGLTDLSLSGGSQSEFVANNPRPDAEAVKRACELLAAAENPVVIAGRNVIGSKACDKLVEFAERLAIPVVTTELGRGSIPESHPLAAGPIGHFGRIPANNLLKKADVVLGLSCHFVNVNTINWSLIPKEAKIIQVEDDPLEIGRQYAVTVGAVASPDAFLEDAIEYARQADFGDYQALRESRSESISREKADEQARIYDVDLNSTPVKPQLIAKVVAEVCDDDAIIVSGMGYHTQFVGHIEINKPDQYLASAGSGALCYALPAGIAAQMANPGRQVIVGLGDGDFGMNAQEVETAVRENLPVVVIVFDDCSYGALRIFQKNLHEGRYIGSDYGPTDFVKLAEAYGAKGELIKQPEELKPALERALESDVCTVLQVNIDPWEEHHRAGEFGDFHKF